MIRVLLIIVLAGSSFFWLKCIKDIPYYDDDYQFYFDPPPQSPFHYFLHKNPRNAYAWRPLEATTLVLIQKKWALNPLPVHFVAVTGYLLIAILIFLIFRKLYDEKIGAIAAILFSIHPAAVHAVASIDALSQIYGVLFTYISCFIFIFCNKSTTRDIPGLVCIAIALLWKESSICILPVLILAYLISGKLNSEKRTLLMILVLTAVYIAVRMLLHFPSLKFGGGGRFGINLFRLPSNLAILWFTALNPFSTLQIFIAQKTKDLAFLIWVGSFFLFNLFLVVKLFLKQKQIIPISIGFFLIGCALLIPTCFFNHVSELYVYSLLPFCCGLIAIFLVKNLELPQWMNLLRKLSLCIFLIASIISVYTKSAAMLSTGKQAEKLTKEVISAVKLQPPGGTLILQNPDCKYHYSIFVACGYEAINESFDWILYKAGRPDVKIEIRRAKSTVE
jgi:Dolichyl-phosphate-mannose-protein mannosyltransferase